MIPREPRRAPKVRDPSPLLQRRSAGVHRGKRSFLLTNLLHCVVWYRFEGEPYRQKFAQRVTNKQLVEEQMSAIARHSSFRAPGWASQACQPRAEQAVAHLEAVIEKTERPISGEGRQPQRQ